MKLAQNINLTRQDSLFLDAEPEKRYKSRQVSVVSDSFDFSDPDINDISSIPNWIKYWRKSGSKSNAVTYMQPVIVDWSDHDQDEKDMFLDFVVNSGEVCCLSSAQKSDIQTMVTVPFTIFENGAVNFLKTWDGTTWV